MVVEKTALFSVVCSIPTRKGSEVVTLAFHMNNLYIVTIEL